MKTLHCCWLFALLLGWISAAPRIATNETTQENAEYNTRNSTTSVMVAENMLKANIATAELRDRCSLQRTGNDVDQTLADIADDTKLIIYTLQIKDYNPQFNIHTKMFKPLVWMRSTGRNGTGLLMLRPEFETLSLSTLAFHVEEVNISLVEKPLNCLSRLATAETEMLFRYTVMNNFRNNTEGNPSIDKHHKVCNTHIIDNQGTAVFSYFCCQVNEHGDVTCEYLRTDVWWQGLLVTIVILKIFLILFWPKFVPDSMYEERYSTDPYMYKQPFSLKVVKTANPKRYQPSVSVKMSDVGHMQKLKRTLESMDEEIPATLNILQTDLSVTNTVLLAENSVPIGISKTLTSIYKCKMQNDPTVSGCCQAEICPSACCRQITWFVAFRLIMKILLVLLIASPWILRVWVYYRYEDAEMEQRKTVASEHGLQMYFPGSFSLYMTPFHATFICIYILLALESVMFRTVRKETVDAFKFVLRKCFRDTSETDRTRAFQWAVKFFLKPFTKFGCLGLLLGTVSCIFTLPIVIGMLAFYFLPTVNLTCRLVAHFVVYLLPSNTCSSNSFCRTINWMLKRLESSLGLQDLLLNEKLMKNQRVLGSAWRRVLQLTAIMLCLISIYCTIYLMYEFVSFLVEICIYTVMGLIVNADTTMTYISLTVMIGAYGINCYSGVTNKYLKFNQTLNSALTKLGMNKIEEIVYLNSAVQGNNVFKVQTETNTKLDTKHRLKLDRRKTLRLMTSRLVLFVSKRDSILIPRKFFFTTSTLDYFGVPGQLFGNYVKAAFEFGGIILFLLFVLNVVLAFGNVYEISTTNQLLGTIAGGFIPFMLKLLFKQKESESVDTGSLAFKVCLNEALEDYTQSFPVSDMNAYVAAEQIVSPTVSENTNNGTVATKKKSYSNGKAGCSSNGVHSADSTVTSYNNINEVNGKANVADIAVVITDAQGQDKIDELDGTYRRFEDTPLIKERIEGDDIAPEWVDLLIDVSNKEVV